MTKEEKELLVELTYAVKHLLALHPSGSLHSWTISLHDKMIQMQKAEGDAKRD